jgi:hypothetical protein
MQFPGEFETHITVLLDEQASIERLQQWGIDHGLHCLHIVLDRGDTTSQPMLTRHGNGEFTDELKKAMELRQLLNAEGFQVVRVKIEAAPDNSGVPQSNPEAANHPSNGYFEHHIKLVLESGDDMLSLTELAAQHSAHLSRNALRIRDDNRSERFITQRCLSVGRVEARQQLQALLDALVPLRHTVIKIEEEFVVYDNNLALDAGWIR